MLLTLAGILQQFHAVVRDNRRFFEARDLRVYLMQVRPYRSFPETPCYDERLTFVDPEQVRILTICFDFLERLDWTRSGFAMDNDSECVPTIGNGVEDEDGTDTRVLRVTIDPLAPVFFSAFRMNIFELLSGFSQRSLTTAIESNWDVGLGFAARFIAFNDQENPLPEVPFHYEG